MMRTVAAGILCVLISGAVWAAEPSLLIRVERKKTEDLALLRSADVPVVQEMRPCLFVLGSDADLAGLRARGYDARVIDRDPQGADYLIVGLRPDSDAAAVRSSGVVLLEEENWVLLRVPAGPIPEAIHEARAFVARMPETPAGMPKPAPEMPEGPPSFLLPNPIITKIVGSVADADIQSYWTSIVNNPPTGTRFSTNIGCTNAATYCFNQYTALKVPVAYQTWSGTNAPNVIGTLDGATNPGDVYIMVAHLDDLPSSGTAPGADDNGSGSATVLEAAKVLSCWGVRNTVKFLNVTGEEQGLFGSEAYAADALTRGENIKGVINYDMVGWQGDGIPAVEDLDLDYNASSQWLAQKMVDAAATYGTGLAIKTILCPSLTVSDHAPFWSRGWSAICGITDNEGYCGAAGNYPPYHTSGDTMAANGNLAFFYKVVRTTVATLAELGDPFKVTFTKSAYGCGAPLSVVLADRDLNTNTGTVQSAVVHVWSTTEPAGEDLTVSERTVNSMLFNGTIPTTSAPPVSGDGVLSMAAGDTLNVQYVDALDCDGANNVAYTATAQTDCVAPGISGVAATNVTGNSASIGWSTNEAANSVVHYGPTVPPAATATNPALVTTHAVGLTGLAECTPYSFSVESADSVGNNSVDTNGGTYYGFATIKNTVPSFASTDTPIAIPDNNGVGAISTINVPDDKIVQDVNVTVNITHTYDGDIALTLIPPIGNAVTLSANRGGSNDNYINTVFDDQAATPIASGTAPFTGSFRPDGVLSSANGIHSIGAWKLKVVDSAGQDVGTINNWSLTLTYPSAQCGPHAAYSSETLVTDTCLAGGAGNADAIWDPGERVQFKVRVNNDGTNTLTGVTATVTPTTPGVGMVDAVTDFPDIPVGASADSLTPHVTAALPSSLACGSNVAFNLSIQSSQGTWTGSFTQAVGATSSGSGTALNESFASGIPGTWSVVDGGVGGGAAATWTTANPGLRTLIAPIVAPAAIVDSDNAGNTASQNEELITPVMNLSTATAVTLEFDQYFRWYVNGQVELGDVDVRSSATGNAWINVFRNQGASSPNPDHKTLNITAQAAGAANVQVRFHYYQAAFEWYWMIDNVKVTYTAPGGCQQHTCITAAPPPPVPNGITGTPMRSDRLSADGGSVALHWDVSTCVAAGYKALYGPLSSVASATVTGAACALGTSGNATWNGVPAGDLWYVVVATDNAGTEGPWGAGSGSSASGQCGDVIRNDAGTCP
jgi:subtilisin-like proprotein convertase family protein